ncbi:MAG: LON peptidase substrate-binding domain-containing protein [Myxococcota bacterium]
MEPEQLEEVAQRLPIFPLPRTVLMPGTTLPLHVFEPRYRALVEHCLATDRVMGVATLRPGYEEDYEGKPALFPEIGVGQIVAHQPFVDGRCNIVLRFEGCVELQGEVDTDELFRIVSGVVVTTDASGIDSALQSLKVLVLQLGSVRPEAAEEAHRLALLEGMELPDALARRLFEQVDTQRAYLAATRLVDRVSLVSDRLAQFLLAASTMGEA